MISQHLGRCRIALFVHLFPLLQHQKGTWGSVLKQGGACMGVIPPREPIYHLCVLIVIFLYFIVFPHCWEVLFWL